MTYGILLALLAACPVLASCSLTAPSWQAGFQEGAEVLLKAVLQPGRAPPLLLPLLQGGLIHDRPAAPGPKLAPQFSAKLVYSGEMMGVNFTDGVGTFHYDRPGQRRRMTYTVVSSYYRPNATQNQDELAKNVQFGPSSNMTFNSQVCMVFGGPHSYMDMFAWMDVALPQGWKVIEGEACRMWSFKVQTPYLDIDESACVGTDGIPREVSETFGDISGKFSGHSHYRLTPTSARDPGDAAFEVSQACATNYPVPPCAVDKVSRLDVYRVFGPPEPLLLQDRNAGDVLGDASFVCTQASGASYRSKLITHWSVNVSESFGQYALCNYDGKDNVCSGPPSQLQHVGRRSSQMAGAGPYLGQCSENEDVGSQYSFPTAAMCPPGVAPGSGCAWGGAKPVRTVQASCIMEDRGLLDACLRDMGHAPFQEAARVWEAAFASDQPALGGCPDAPTSGPVQTVVI